MYRLNALNNNHYRLVSPSSCTILVQLLGKMLKLKASQVLVKISQKIEEIIVPVKGF